MPKAVKSLQKNVVKPVFNANESQAVKINGTEHKNDLLQLAIRNPLDGSWDKTILKQKAIKSTVNCLLCLSNSNDYECERCEFKYCKDCMKEEFCLSKNEMVPNTCHLCVEMQKYWGYCNGCEEAYIPLQNMDWLLKISQDYSQGVEDGIFHTGKDGHPICTNCFAEDNVANVESAKNDGDGDGGDGDDDGGDDDSVESEYDEQHAIKLIAMATKNPLPDGNYDRELIFANTNAKKDIHGNYEVCVICLSNSKRKCECKNCALIVCSMCMEKDKCQLCSNVERYKNFPKKLM